MTLSIQNISSTISASPEKLKNIFNRFITSNVVEYGIFARYVYNRTTVNLPTLNALSYGLVIFSFVTAVTTYLFISIIWGSIYAKLEPPIDPYQLRPEFRASILKSTESLAEFESLPSSEIPGATFRFYADTSQLNIGTVTDINFLLGVLDSRQDLVLLFAPDDKSIYLMQRIDDCVRSRVMNNKFILHSLPPVVVPVFTPQPKEEESLVNQELLAASDLATSPSMSDIQDQNDLSASRMANSFIQLDVPNQGSIGPPLPTMGLIRTTFISAWGQLVGYHHLAKEIKYRHILEHLYKLVTVGKGLAQYNLVYKTANSPLRTQCLKLYEIITNPHSVNARKQNEEFIYALREAQRLLKDQDNPACKDWIHLLAMNRFAGVRLYGYCKSLVELATKISFNSDINLENFWDQLESRIINLKKLPIEQALTKTVLAWQKFLGRFNLKDFLIASNIPYIYGQLKIGERIVTILRHGTPVAPAGYFRISQITEDYLAFIDAAAAQNQNILHLIAENLHDSFEGVRVQARLALASKSNFFPWAIRFDGDFIEPKNYQIRTVEQVKKEFSEQMYGENTGYSVPNKLRQKGLSEADFKEYMESVQDTFFKGQEKFETIQEFQAFIVLTYAEAALSICTKLNISFLEALCKDDIDRGGAMKAIIVLLHLYKTGKFAAGNAKQLSQALEELMVNIIAAPLIVKKQPILKDRASYIYNVIEVMKRTIVQTPTPIDVYAGNFNVLSEPYQGVTPMGSTCRTEQEYQDYLQQVKEGQIVLKTTLDQNIVELSARTYRQTKNPEPIKSQISRDTKGLYMNLNGDQLNSDLQENSTISATILSTLNECNIQDDEAWSILAAFTQTIGSDLILSLQPLFNNERLSYIITPDPERMKKDKSSGLYLRTQLNKASIQLVVLFNISSATNKAVIARIRTTIDIPDHRHPGATVTTIVDP